MRKSRFTDEQMVKMLRDANRTSVAEFAKKHGVSEQTVYLWPGFDSWGHRISDLTMRDHDGIAGILGDRLCDYDSAN